MDMYEKTISSQSIFKGVIVDLRVDQIQLPNGDGSVREVVSMPVQGITSGCGTSLRSSSPKS